MMQLNCVSANVESVGEGRPMDAVQSQPTWGMSRLLLPYLSPHGLKRVFHHVLPVYEEIATTRKDEEVMNDTRGFMVPDV